jgi:hypothetical protein
MKTAAQFALEAQQAGFHVELNERKAWSIITPARPRRPSETLGDYKTSERAWMAAALTAKEFAQ